jgi:hypothetical protein
MFVGQSSGVEVRARFGCQERNSVAGSSKVSPKISFAQIRTNLTVVTISDSSDVSGKKRRKGVVDCKSGCLEQRGKIMSSSFKS